MNTIVIYESKTGFTAQYAQWIAEELGCESVSLKQITKENLNQYDKIIFGGRIMANMIMGLDKLSGMTSNLTAVFAVGATPAYEEVIQAIKTQNKLSDVSFFYMEGGFHFEQLGFAQQILLKTLKKSVAKKENPSRQEAFMAQALGTSFDHSEKNQIYPLVEECK